VLKLLSSLYRCRTMVRGASTGLLLGGWLYQAYGPIRMFKLQAIGIGVTCVFYLSVVAGPHTLKQHRRHAFRSGGSETDGLDGRLLESPTKGS
jgi:hypothetical protein